ncbi:MAG: metalloregulator ArsR/SmtB family transcription factor [bacterium]
MKFDQAKVIASVLKALAHPARLRVVEALVSGPKTSADLASSWRVGQSTMSRHLTLLVQAGIVEAHNAGQRVVYRLSQPSILRCLSGVRELRAESR